MDLQPAKVRELRNCDMEKKLKIALDMRKLTDYKNPAVYLQELATAIEARKSTKKVCFLKLQVCLVSVKA